MGKMRSSSIQTKESLLDKSLELFLLQGYSKTTQEDIVNALNLTRGAFYWHFNDKEDLLSCLLNREMSFISSLIVDAFIFHEHEKLQLKKLLENIITNFYSNKRFRDIIKLTWFKMEVEFSGKVMMDKVNFNEFLLEEIVKVLRIAKRKGKLNKGVSPVESAMMLVSLITGMYRLYFVTPNYFEDEKTMIKISLKQVDSIFK